VTELLGQVRSDTDDARFIPISALKGDNVGCNVRGVGEDDIRRGDVAGEIPELCPFAVRDMGQTVAADRMLEITDRG
jgi:translation elongation factor EF-1alpha